MIIVMIFKGDDWENGGYLQFLVITALVILTEPPILTSSCSLLNLL